MALDKQLMAIESKLWSNDAVFYKDNLIEEALLVFPETGIITRDVAVVRYWQKMQRGDDGLRCS